MNPLNIQTNFSDIVAAPRRVAALSQARLVVDCAQALLLEANAPARKALGLAGPLRRPLPLDAAMPALQTLRAGMSKSGLADSIRLTFWSAGGVHDWHCRIERVAQRGGRKSHVVVTVLADMAPVSVSVSVSAPKRAVAPPAAAHAAGGASDPPTATVMGEPTLSIEAIARLAHELRAPVSAIVAAADVMAEGHLGALRNERYQSYIVGIRDTARHLLGVVEAMLASPAAAIVTGTGHARSDVGAAVREVAHGLGAVAETAGIALRLNLATRLPDIAADRTALRQMIYNLLSNALRHAGAGAQVTARTGCEASGEIWLEVADDGPGIPRDTIERTFLADSPDCASAGLGLLLTRKLAEAAGAKLSLDAAPAGTRARITFPPCAVPRAATPP